MRIFIHRSAACAALAVGILIVSSSTASATNLIKNGSFETPTVPVGSYKLFSPGQARSGWTSPG